MLAMSAAKNVSKSKTQLIEIFLMKIQFSVMIQNYAALWRSS